MGSVTVQTSILNVRKRLSNGKDWPRAVAGLQGAKKTFKAAGALDDKGADRRYLAACGTSFLLEGYESMVTARTIMKTNVIAVRTDTDIYEAIRTMVANNITGLPVVDADGCLAGIVTEKDILSLLYDIEDKPGTAADYMTHEVVAFDEDDDVIAIRESLVHNHFRRVPILSQGRLTGIISRRDLIKYIIEPIGSSS
jgi:CBS domain-containing protein